LLNHKDSYRKIQIKLNLYVINDFESCKSN
jgi:hypothetical protein